MSGNSLHRAGLHRGGHQNITVSVWLILSFEKELVKPLAPCGEEKQFLTPSLCPSPLPRLSLCPQSLSLPRATTPVFHRLCVWIYHGTFLIQMQLSRFT